MKNFSTETSLGCIKVVDENEKLIGEKVFDIILGLNEKIKIGNEVFKIKSKNFFSRNINVFDTNGKLILESDILNSRIIHFGEHTDIYVCKKNKWYSNKLFLYRNDELISSVDSQGMFSTEYQLEVKEDFDNYLIILTFLSFFIREL